MVETIAPRRPRVTLTRGRGTLVRDDEQRIGAGPTRNGLRDRAHVDSLNNWSVNNWSMPEIDLNADLAEGDALTPSDVAVLDAVTSVSVACGFHAGGPSVMRETVRACVERGVTVGAHISYRDREGFGRRVVEVEPARLVEDLVQQCLDLAEIARSLGAEVAYVKPHGALYHQMGSDPLVAAAVCEATSRQGVGVLVAQGGPVVDLARQAGLRVVQEGFPDRAYRSDGALVDRGIAGAVITDPDEVGRRACSLVGRGGVEAINGEWTPVAVETLCIHGDSPAAAQNARTVRTALIDAGVTLRSFVEPPSGGGAS
jgi:5-oxoprolinase (ATP-hydrolysing) subunit A